MPFLLQKNKCAISHRKERGMSEKMVKVRVTKDYKDKEKMLLFQTGEEHEVKQSRADELVKAGVAELVDTKKNNSSQGAAGNKEDL